MINTIDKRLFLEEFATELDISPTNYDLANKRYKSVAKYLEDNGIKAEFYPQGSFRLGTVVSPYKKDENGNYDLDFVCEMVYSKEDVTPKYIKELIGDVLNIHGTYKKMLKNGRRCWTITYAEQNGVGFHMDILPSVREDALTKAEIEATLDVNGQFAPYAIAITNKDKKTSIIDWHTSNPYGYGAWFDEINRSFFTVINKTARQTWLFENYRDIYESINDVPEQMIKTPLQRVIQILKRHRDTRFCDTPYCDDAPISMIITTLSALIAQKFSFVSADTFRMLEFITDKLTEYAPLTDERTLTFESSASSKVIKRYANTKKWEIPNPVNPKENFADKWHENNGVKSKAFFQWLQWVKEDIVEPLKSNDIHSLTKVLGGSVDVAYENYIHKTNKTTKSTPTVNIKSPQKPWSRRLGV